MVHNALPRQLMPRAVTKDAPNMMERRVLGRMVEAIGREMDLKQVVKMGEIICAVQRMWISGVIL